METTVELHLIQAKILRTLLFRTEARFSDLNVVGLTNDHFTFHLKRLVELSLVERLPNQRYQLTTKGKEFANRLDTEKIRIEKQAKIGVLIVCRRKKGKSWEYLMQQRLKQPYYGFCGFLTGKIGWGETILETAQRELKEETGLSAKLTLFRVKHKMDYSPQDELLDDKYFFIFRGEDCQGKLMENFEGGKNFWKSEKEIAKLPDLFDGVAETIQATKQRKTFFSEKKYTVSRF